jgi:hypothetical protein
VPTEMPCQNNSRSGDPAGRGISQFLDDYCRTRWPLPGPSPWVSTIASHLTQTIVLPEMWADKEHFQDPASLSKHLGRGRLKPKIEAAWAGGDFSARLSVIFRVVAWWALKIRYRYQN